MPYFFIDARIYEGEACLLLLLREIRLPSSLSFAYESNNFTGETRGRESNKPAFFPGRVFVTARVAPSSDELFLTLKYTYLNLMHPG